MKKLFIVIPSLSATLLSLTGCPSPVGVSPERRFNETRTIVSVIPDDLAIMVYGGAPCKPDILVDIRKAWEPTGGSVQVVDANGNTRYQPEFREVENRIETPKETSFRQFSITGSLRHCKKLTDRTTGSVTVDTNDCKISRFSTAEPVPGVPIYASHFNLSVQRGLNLLDRVELQDGGADVYTDRDELGFKANTGNIPIVSYKFTLSTHESLFEREEFSKTGSVSNVEFLMACGNSTVTAKKVTKQTAPAEIQKIVQQGVQNSTTNGISPDMKQYLKKVQIGGMAQSLKSGLIK